MYRRNFSLLNLYAVTTVRLPLAMLGHTPLNSTAIVSSCRFYAFHSVLARSYRCAFRYRLPHAQTLCFVNNHCSLDGGLRDALWKQSMARPQKTLQHSVLASDDSSTYWPGLEWIFNLLARPPMNFKHSGPASYGSSTYWPGLLWIVNILTWPPMNLHHADQASNKSSTPWLGLLLDDFYPSTSVCPLNILEDVFICLCSFSF